MTDEPPQPKYVIKVLWGYFKKPILFILYIWWIWWVLKHWDDFLLTTIK